MDEIQSATVDLARYCQLSIHQNAQSGQTEIIIIATAEHNSLNRHFEFEVTAHLPITLLQRIVNGCHTKLNLNY